MFRFRKGVLLLLVLLACLIPGCRPEESPTPSRRAAGRRICPNLRKRGRK